MDLSVQILGGVLLHRKWAQSGGEIPITLPVLGDHPSTLLIVVLEGMEMEGECTRVSKDLDRAMFVVQVVIEMRNDSRPNRQMLD